MDSILSKKEIKKAIKLLAKRTHDPALDDPFFYTKLENRHPRVAGLKVEKSDNVPCGEDDV